jgi:hypothetical protein
MRQRRRLLDGQAITVGPGGSAGPSGLTGPAYIAPAVPAPPAPAVTDPGLVSSLASPGLAGTAGIQPQMDLEVLRDRRWDELWDVLLDAD